MSRNYFEELPPEGWSFEGAPRLDPFDAAFINQALDSTKASDCITVIEQAERQQAFWSSVQARAAARIDSLTGCTPEDHPVDQERGTAHMVAIARRRSQSGSISYLHCMRNLIPDMPYLFSRFEAGDLSESLVLAIMGPLDDLPSDERRIFDRMYAHAPSLFDSMSTKAARDFAQKYVDTNHSEEQTLRMEKKARDRFVHIRPGKDCMLVNARLPIEVGLALKNDLESKAMAAKSAGDQRTLEQLRADALVGTATGAPLDRPLPVKLHINLVMTDKRSCWVRTSWPASPATEAFPPNTPAAWPLPGRQPAPIHRKKCWICSGAASRPCRCSAGCSWNPTARIWSPWIRRNASSRGSCAR
ncbi:DUF222 domain-containing protein [Glutamicibacter protophormiae]|uniref:DUF222 domain-containing protein n=1 Tax=Glutamicibacter protophormiae TaxID=37930 RepID=UPI003320314F